LASQASSSDEIVIKSKEYAFYMFELLAEYHLPQELIVQNQENFMNLFSESMKDTNPRVRVATLKALTTFITSIDDEEQVLKYSMMMNNLLDIVIENLKTDEAQGRSSLESLIDLTSSYSEIWGQSKANLIHVCSEIMKNKEFEDSTRETSLEIITTLAEENPKMLKSLSDKL
jgi:DNA primase